MIFLKVLNFNGKVLIGLMEMLNYHLELELELKGVFFL